MERTFDLEPYTLSISKRGKKEFMTIRCRSGVWSMTLRGDSSAFAVIKEMCLSGYLEYARIYIQMNFMMSGITPDETFVNEFIESLGRYNERLGETIRPVEAESDGEALKEAQALHDAKRRLTGTVPGE